MTKYRYFSIILLTLCFFACRKEIDIDLRTAAPLLVVQAEIAEGDSARVKLTKSRGFYEPNVFLPITDAVITLSDDAGTAETLTLVGDTVYYSYNMMGEAGRTYNLSINYDGKTYTSQSKLLPAVPIDTIITQVMPISEMPPIFSLTFTDPLGLEINYYRFRLFVNNEKKIKGEQVTSADILDGEVLTLPFMIYPEDNKQDTIYVAGDSIKFVMMTIDKGTYDFFAGLGRGKTNPASNISGGALGYFSAYSQVEKTVEVPEWNRR
jgi:hypothetical protein